MDGQTDRQTQTDRQIDRQIDRQADRQIAKSKQAELSLVLAGDVFSQSEMAQTLSEITRIDPQFNKDKFLHECEFEIIPSVLEVGQVITQFIEWKE